MLEKLQLNGNWEKGAGALLLDALRTGACRLLQEVPYFYRGIDDDGEEELEAVADMLEIRAQMGTCRGPINLDENWWSHGSIALQVRLLGLLLQFLVRLPYDVELTEEMANMIKMESAPSLKRFEIHRRDWRTAPLIEALPSMCSLLHLWLLWGAFDDAAANRFIDLLDEYHGKDQILLPNLEALVFSGDFGTPASERRILEAIERICAFKNVRQLKWHLANDYSGDVFDAFLSALHEGAFPFVEKFGAHAPQYRDGDFAGLLQALQVAPCGKTLKELMLVNSAFKGRELNELAVGISNGCFPSLEILYLSKLGLDETGNEAVVSLAAALVSRRHDLRELHLKNWGMNDAGLEALLGAAEAGRFAHIRRFDVSKNAITEAGILLLAQVVAAGHMPELEKLYVIGAGTTKRAAAALITAIVDQCPDFICLHLPVAIMEHPRNSMAAQFEHLTGKKIIVIANP